jgi:hypothetical protein
MSGISADQLLAELSETWERIKPPEPQNVVIHPDDFEEFKTGLEKEGLTFTAKPHGNWEVTVGELMGLVMQVVVSPVAPKGSALTMPMAEYTNLAPTWLRQCT